jgi:hypothetical protein
MKGERTKYLPLILSFFIVLSMMSTALAPPAPPPLPLMSMSPATHSYNPGDSFTIDVNIQDVTDLFSYEVKVGYNPGILHMASIAEGPFVKDQTTSPLGTLWSTIQGVDFVYAVCVTLGKYPGVSGSGKLFSVTFNVIDLGECDLDLYDSIMLDSTGALIPHDVADGFFSTPHAANLVRRSAWPEHHHFVISKDEDFDGTYANQTLNGKVKNIGTIDMLVKVVFDIMQDDTYITSVSSDATLVTPDTIVQLSANFKVSSTDAGKYYASARAYYSWSGNYYHLGEKVKTFSFAVLP